jgi:hypothetical protein
MYNKKYIFFITIIVILVLIILTNIYINIKFSPLYDEKDIKNISDDNNEMRHKACVDKKYGKFSKINTRFPSIFKFPLYYLSSPVTYVLHPGEYLFIPKKWWHWVITKSNSGDLYNTAYNILGSVDKKYTNPHKQKFMDNGEIREKMDIINDTIKNKEINLWCKNEKGCVAKLDSFIKEREKYSDCYIVSLDVKINGDDVTNKNIFEFIKNKMKIPNIIDKINNIYFWINTGNIDTGLHYDEENSILCVLSGIKIVTLYPPSDTKFLYPH